MKTTLAGNLGMQVIAEGVETEDQLQHLRLLKCQYGQGFLFAKPLSVSEADRFLVNEGESVTVELHIAEAGSVTFAM